ncbi:uncharacterized protein LOC129761347 [Toxorhynchites rutilus septentrionalis]|uniref:uncharacterized protein LOC129761347 n=1 Tax=Toxorhynchites rutilus septentrionalis TaxID=329112 RepID=UPI002478A0A4|nr:uncharacterized protein LOC129761347 [Toxorhynchites rutilus septentrionalis]
MFLPPNFERSKLETPSKSTSINCFPPADRTHTYEWAGGFTQNHFLDELNTENSGTDMDSSAEELERESNNVEKRNNFGRELSSDLYTQHPSSCACQTKYELLDLGYTHFPRYIVNAICLDRNFNSRKCWRGSRCREIPYKVRVLTKRSEDEPGEQDNYSALLPEPLRDLWRFRTVTIAAACQCSL